MRRLMLDTFFVWIKIDLIDIGTDGTQYIGIGIVTDHDTIGGLNRQLVHEILENPRIRLFVTCGFGGHYKVKIRSQSRRKHFLGLTFVEAISDNMHLIVGS